MPSLFPPLSTPLASSVLDSQGQLKIEQTLNDCCNVLVTDASVTEAMYASSVDECIWHTGQVYDRTMTKVCSYSLRVFNNIAMKQTEQWRPS